MKGMLALFCALVLLTSSSSAQAFFAGNTYEDFGGSPIASGVQVALKSCAYGMDENGNRVDWTTVQDGMFILQLEAGTHEIEVTYGANKTYFTIELENGSIFRKDLFLSAGNQLLPKAIEESDLNREDFVFTGLWRLKSMRAQKSIRDSMTIFMSEVSDQDLSFDFTTHEFFLEFETAESAAGLAGRISFSDECKRSEYIYYRINSSKVLTLNSKNQVEFWNKCRVDRFVLCFEEIMAAMNDSLQFAFAERELHLEFNGNLLILERAKKY